MERVALSSCALANFLPDGRLFDVERRLTSLMDGELTDRAGACHWRVTSSARLASERRTKRATDALITPWPQLLRTTDTNDALMGRR